MPKTRSSKRQRAAAQQIMTPEEKKLKNVGGVFAKTAIAIYLFVRYPDAGPGELTRKRANNSKV